MGKIYVVRKRPIIQIAEQVTERVAFETVDGNSAYVEPPNWLMTGVKGEKYPCRDDIFRQSFNFVREAAPIDIEFYGQSREDGCV